MEWFDFLALVLASSAALEAWFKGSLFAALRAVMQDKDDQLWNGPGPESRSPERIAAEMADDEELAVQQPRWLQLVDWLVPDFVGSLLSCAFCTSYHAPFWLGLLFWVPSLWLAEPWSALVKLPIYALAATRAGNILTGLLPAKLRYEDEDDTNDGEDMPRTGV